MFIKDYTPWKGPHTGAGKECKEETAAESMCGELTAPLIPHPPALLRAEGRQIRREAEPGKKGGEGKVFQDLILILSLKS